MIIFYLSPYLWTRETRLSRNLLRPYVAIGRRSHPSLQKMFGVTRASHLRRYRQVQPQSYDIDSFRSVVGGARSISQFLEIDDGLQPRKWIFMRFDHIREDLEAFLTGQGLQLQLPDEIINASTSQPLSAQMLADPKIWDAVLQSHHSADLRFFDGSHPLLLSN